MQTLSFIRPSRKPGLLALALIATPVLAQAQAQDPAKAAMTEPQVRALLTEKGYTRMDDLDFEDGMWETDATSADGNRVDVRVNPANGDIKAETLVSNFSENDIKARLAAAGYSKVHDVDFDDGMWKAEAERADGNDVEVHLDATTGAIVHVEND
ncbi:PepSY domain-containing protein [Pseudoxanthomonas sp.]|uniref:PepSY domain-containing protein n=1 Tax=Pseudoxanthomonas sp. TaxID=1871049 RepID=UPI003F800816